MNQKRYGFARYYFYPGNLRYWCSSAELSSSVFDGKFALSTAFRSETKLIVSSLASAIIEPKPSARRFRRYTTASMLYSCVRCGSPDACGSSSDRWWLLATLASSLVFVAARRLFC